MLIWSQRMDEKALKGMTRQQFAKYGLLRLGVGENITRIERNGVPRRVAPAEEVYALRPELKLPSQHLAFVLYNRLRLLVEGISRRWGF